MAGGGFNSIRIFPDVSNDYQRWVREYTSSPSSPDSVRLVDADTAGNIRIELNPPPANARVYGYEYQRRPRNLIETTAGQIESISSGSVQVNGLPNTRFDEITSGDWLRINDLGVGDDSNWYRVIKVTDNSDLTLATAFATTAVTSANYSISRAPEMPAKLHPAVLWGALRHVTIDQEDPAAAYYDNKMAEVLSDGKRIYVSRVYSQELKGLHEDWNYRR